MTPLLSNQLLRTQSDERLTALASSGHDRAFEAIVERYRKPLARYLRRLLSEPLAEDVLQATFVRAWQAMGTGTEVRELRPWLYRIAHNQAVNALRAAAVSLPDSPGVPDALPAASLELEVERREDLRQTLRGIGELPDRQRAALVAVAVSDRAHADVAAELGLSDGALRQLLLRARTALRTAATALTPYPLIGWFSAGQEVTTARVAEVAAGAGGAGLAFKAGAAVVAAGALVASGPTLRDEHAPPRAKATATHDGSRTLADDHRAPAVAKSADDRAVHAVPVAEVSATGAAKKVAAPRAHKPSGNGGGGSNGHPSGTSGGNGSGDDGAGHSQPNHSGSGSGPSGSGSGSDESDSASHGSGESESGRSGSGSRPSGSGDSGSQGSGESDSGGSVPSELKPSHSDDGEASHAGVTVPPPPPPADGSGTPGGGEADHSGGSSGD